MRHYPAYLISLLLLCAAAAHAHAPASSVLTLDLANDHAATLTADLALTDVAQLLPLDADRDGQLSWGEIRGSEALLHREISGATVLQRDGADCALNPDPGALALVRYSGTLHVSARYIVDCAADGSRIALAFGLFDGINPQHRVISRVHDGTSTHLAVTRVGDNGFSVDLSESGSAATMLHEGVLHILGGYDHLLFLLLLILPTIGIDKLRRRLLRLFGIITAFTVAHSITLAMAALGYVSLPSQWVEIAIAASIVFAGVVNIVRPGHHIGWQLAFGFGLLHGFGFAGALAELGLGGSRLLLQLFAFNVGVEIGQLAVVLVALPLLLVLTLLPRYRQILVPLMSAGGAGMGVVWVASRL